MPFMPLSILRKFNLLKWEYTAFLFVICGSQIICDQNPLVLRGVVGFQMENELLIPNVTRESVDPNYGVICRPLGHGVRTS